MFMSNKERKSEQEAQTLIEKKGKILLQSPQIYAYQSRNEITLVSNTALPLVLTENKDS